MKRILAAVGILSAIIIAGTVVSRAGTEVTSVNVVGYMKITIPSNGMVLVSAPFDNLTGAYHTVSELIGSQMPNGSLAYLWDRTTKQYTNESYGRSGWAPGNTKIYRGDAFWIKGPAAFTGGVITIMGEVPDSIGLDSTTTVYTISGSDAVGYPYPTPVVWTDTKLAQSAAIGDALFVWQTNQAYVSYSRNRGGWDTPAGFTINPGQGFWYKKSAAGTINWNETVPYNLH